MYSFPPNTKLVNTLIIETKWIIWKHRNDMKYYNKTSSCNVLLNYIITNVKNKCKRTHAHVNAQPRANTHTHTHAYFHVI